jgi:hypothetical protein
MSGDREQQGACSASTEPSPTTEEWRDVLGFESAYEVSNLGYLRSKKTGAALKLQSRGRYLAASLKDAPKKSMRSVHVAVAEAFLGPRPQGLEVAHLNGDARDNRLTNLAYVTTQENEAHKRQHGTSRALLKPEQAEILRNLVGRGVSQTDLANLLGVSIQVISKAVAGQNYKPASGLAGSAASVSRAGHRWHDQTILHSEATRGNCMQAAVAGILGLPMREVPHFAARPDRAAHLGLINFAASYGFDLVRDDCHKHFQGFYLGCGPTERGTHHMVVMRDGALFHDPHPSRAGLLKVEFVYTFLPMDPATHVAGLGFAKDIAPLLAKASAGPWTSESLDSEDGWGRCASSEILDAHGETVLDALNSNVACIAEESDEDGRRRWDEQGAADTAYVVALDNLARRLVAGAPGIAARSAETEGLGPTGKSPTAESGAPKTSLNPGSGANG